MFLGGENTIADKKLAAAIDQLSNKEISYDEYCKKVLMNKYVLSHISRHVITEFKGMSIKEVLTCLEPDTKEGMYGNRSSDIKCSLLCGS